jgi:hypothetical protein
VALDHDPAAATNELERLISDLSDSGELVFVFGVGWHTTHLTGTTQPLFRGPQERRWWHVELGADETKWVMDIRVDEISCVRFVRESNPFPHFPGQESLIVRFVGPHDDSVLSCYLADLYDGQTLRQDKVSAWEKLRERYGNRSESRVEGGSLRPLVVAA